MKRIKNRGALPAYLAVAAVSMLLVVVFGFLKSDYHVDEMFSYSLVASDTPYGYPVTASWNTREQNLETFILTEETAFDFSLVYTNQAGDVHPPLYYIVLRAALQLAYATGIGFTKWIGIGVNLVFLALNFLLLYKICRLVWNSGVFCVVVGILYGLGYATIHYAIFLRMYVMLGTAVLLLLYIHLRLLAGQAFGAKQFAAVALAVVGATLTQYYAVLYLFFMCVPFGLYMLYHKRVKTLLVWAGAVLAGLAGSVALFPPLITHITESDRGVQAQGNITSMSIANILTRLRLLGLETWGYLGFFALLCLVALLCAKGFRGFLAGLGVSVTGMVFILVSTASASMLIAGIMPFNSLRYLSGSFAPLAICFAFGVCAACAFVAHHKPAARKAVCGFAAVLVAAGLAISYTSENDDLLYRGRKQEYARLAEAAEEPFVMVLRYEMQQTANFMAVQQFEKYFSLLYVLDDQVERLETDPVLDMASECYLFLCGEVNGDEEAREFYFALMREKTGAENVEWLFTLSYGQVYHIY